MVFMLVIAFLTGLIPVSDAQAAKKPKTIAHAYYMIDAKSGKKILSSHANKKIYPASTAKLLTALTIMDYADLDQKIKYTKKWCSILYIAPFFRIKKENIRYAQHDILLEPTCKIQASCLGRQDFLAQIILVVQPSIFQILSTQSS